jgi:hypothetical protein
MLRRPREKAEDRRRLRPTLRVCDAKECRLDESLEGIGSVAALQLEEREIRFGERIFTILGLAPKHFQAKWIAARVRGKKMR